MRGQVFKAVVVEMLVRFKPEVPNPESVALAMLLQDQGFGQVSRVEKGKYFQVSYENVTLRQARIQARLAGKRLLANPVTEEFEIINIRS